MIQPGNIGFPIGTGIVVALLSVGTGVIIQWRKGIVWLDGSKRLAYETWLDSDSLGATRHGEGMAHLMEITNSADVEASDISVSIKYHSRSQSFSVGNPYWLEFKRHDSARTIRWTPSIDPVPPKESQYVVLWFVSLTVQGAFIGPLVSH
jgi:hypothetical protein